MANRLGWGFDKFGLFISGSLRPVASQRKRRRHFLWPEGYFSLPIAHYWWLFIGGRLL